MNDADDCVTTFSDASLPQLTRRYINNVHLVGLPRHAHTTRVRVRVRLGVLCQR
jgi:hypothetical protein